MQVDLIVFEVGSSTFALNLEFVNRINTIPKITPIASSSKFVEGMISYESSILHVISFRTIIDQINCSDELLELFNELKRQHEVWLKALQESIESGVEFRGVLDAHVCELGKWIDSFTSYDDKVSATLKELTSNHTKLHNLGADIVELIKNSKVSDASRLFEKELNNIYNQTMEALNLLISDYKVVADSLQKLLLYKNDEEYFAIKVDKIVDIVHIDDENIVKSNDVDSKVKSAYITFDGVLEMDGILINVVKNIRLPK